MKELMDILVVQRRRMVLARVADSAAVVACWAGAGAAGVAGAWAASQVSAAWGVGICLAVGACACAMLAMGPVRRKLEMSGSAVASAIVVAGVCVGGAGCIAGGLSSVMPAWLAALAAVAAGGAVGACIVVFPGVSLRSAALAMDIAGKLDERVATALELWQGPDRDRPYAMAVYRQAMDALDKTNWRRWRLRSRGARTGWTLTLVLLACAVLCAAPEFGRQDAQARELASRIMNASPKVRQEIADQVARAAEAQSGERKKQLERLGPMVVLPPDPKELEKAIAELKERGVELNKVLSPEIVEQLAAMDKLKKEGGLAIGKVDPNIKVVPLAPLPDRTGPAAVGVYDPEIARAAAKRPASTNGGDGEFAVAGESVDSDDAWRIARERAAGALESGEIAPDYRDIMRNFFEPGKNMKN